MVFFDTCIWIELCAATTPITPEQIRQATAAGNLLNQIQGADETIVTCAEQLLEVISAVQKVKMREYNKVCKQNSTNGVGQLKEFKKTPDFRQTQNLCKQAVEDICHLAQTKHFSGYSLDDILNHLHLVDINDHLYYQYCISENIDFYTFDRDFSNLGYNEKIHIV